MPEYKKSFILYTDIIHTLKKLPKEQAGILFLTILQFVNDENPVIEDLIVELVFEPIKHQLKRDLIIWEKKLTQRSLNGKLGGLAKASNAKKILLNPSSATKTLANLAVNVNVNDNVNVIKKGVFKISEIEINKSIEFIHLTERKLLTSDQVKNYYHAFDISAAEKFYVNDYDKLKHFKNWLKHEVNRKKKDITPEVVKNKSMEEILAKYK